MSAHILDVEVSEEEKSRKACEVRVDAATSAVKQPERWVKGKNGGRLRPGTITPGPRRATTVVRRALVEALKDPRGGSGKEFFVKLKTGSAEDRRTFANVVTKLIPVEVQNDFGEALKIVINTFVAAPISEMSPARAGLERTSSSEERLEIEQPTARPTVVEVIER